VKSFTYFLAKTAEFLWKVVCVRTQGVQLCTHIATQVSKCSNKLYTISL
jgi:hypothetical protein